MPKKYNYKERQAEEILESFDRYNLIPVEFSELKDKTFTAVHLVKGSDEGDMLIFCCDDGINYYMFHRQDCCEYVTVEDICGDLEDLVGSQIRIAAEVVSRNRIPDGVSERKYYDDLYQYTFYKLDSYKGGVTIRWFGSSNGYYSVTVSLYRDPREDEQEDY